MLGFIGRRRRDQAEQVRADVFSLAVIYADKPVPFWPADFPSVYEESELPYKASALSIVDDDAPL